MDQNMQYYPKNDLYTPCDNACVGGCDKFVKHETEVNIPVKIKPNAKVGKINAECCGEPQVFAKKDKQGNACEISVIQKLEIKIPIKYDVVTCVGEAEFDCKGECK